jgi:coatomer subunit delta
MELKGDMNLQIMDPALAFIKLALGPPSVDFVNALQFKQHPNVAKFAPGQDRVVALKDPKKPFPVNQSLTVLRWRYAGTDESNVPLSSKIWHDTLDRQLKPNSSKLLACSEQRRNVRSQHRV